MQRPATHHPSGGFTLIELLVTISVIGVMVSLLLPAVMQARGAAGRSGCQDHLRQQGIALHSYAAARGSFPPGSDAHKQHYHSWITQVLPHLGESTTYDQYDFEAAYDAPENASATSIGIGVVRCPSAAVDGVGKTDYGGIHGSSLSGMTPGYERGGAWEAGVLILVGVDLPEFGFRGSPVRPAEVTDGLSRTLMVGESVDRYPGTDGVWAAGHSCFAQESPRINAGRTSDLFSLHPGGANTMTADGAVRFLSESTDAEVLGALCTRNGGESFEL